MKNVIAKVTPRNKSEGVFVDEEAAPNEEREGRKKIIILVPVSRATVYQFTSTETPWP